eukprot:c12323_g1_i3.p1 GENE.c12323_g1_i3~~c12323_g1_i3.p1  ORF type:complete len:193 (+),score=24.50 c12323_g1_i3:501-1079(+)
MSFNRPNHDSAGCRKVTYDDHKELLRQRCREHAAKQRKQLTKHLREKRSDVCFDMMISKAITDERNKVEAALRQFAADFSADEMIQLLQSIENDILEEVHGPEIEELNQGLGVLCPVCQHRQIHEGPYSFYCACGIQAQKVENIATLEQLRLHLEALVDAHRLECFESPVFLAENMRLVMVCGECSRADIVL